MNASMNTIGIALVWCTVQITLLGFLAAGLYLLVRRLRPAAAGSVVLCSMTMVVVLSLLAFSPWPRWIEPSAARSSRGPAEPVAGNSSPAVEGGTAAKTVRMDHASLPSAGEEATARPSGPAAMAAVWQAVLGEMAQSEIADQQSAWHWPAMAAMVLLAAMACGLGWLVLGIVAVHWQRLGSRPVRDAELLELVEMLRAELGCRRPVELRQADDLSTAATIGWRKPVLLLPADWTTWTDDQRRAILAHEIAHARSQDFLALLFGQLGLVLHFYHPLLHWLMNRLRLEQELAADAAAASISGGQRQYLTTIAELALHQQGRPLLWPARAFLPTQTTFLRRIAMLRDSKLRLGRLSLLGRASTIVAVLLCGLLVAGLRGSGGPAPARADDGAKPAGTVAADESIDTTFLSEKTRAMVIVRPAAIVVGPEMEKLAKLLEATGNAVPAGTHLADFRQITVMIPEKEIPSGPRELVVMQWVKPVAEAHLMQFVPKEGYTIKESDGKKRYVVSHVGTWLLYDDRTLIYAGSEQAMDAYLAEKRGVLPEWMPAEAWESFRHDQLVMGASAAQVRADMKIATKMPPVFRTPIMAMAPLWQDSVGMAAGARLDGALAVHGWLGAKDAESAARARDMANAMRTLLQAASTSARASLQPPAPPKPMATMLLDMADRLLEVAKLQQEGNVARLETSFAIDKEWLGNLVSAIDRTFAHDQAARDPNTQQGLMLLVEDYFKHNYIDITSRETIEWGQPEKTADGNFSIRYKYRAKIWDKATVVNNEVFTFNKNGDYVSVKKLPYDVSTREGIMSLVEDFFLHNYRDITSRETIEWGEPAKTADGHFTIRYKYRAKIWDKETIVNDEVFTFDKDGKSVSVRNLARDPSTKQGLMTLVDVFLNNDENIASHEALEWGEPAKTAEGNFAIRCKFRATMKDKETKVINRVFTFDKDGKSISVKDVEEAAPAEKKS
jgi:beta-lactamase regulating signal transducer with metallopeptidase domain